MKKIGIFYGSDSGNTEEVCKSIAKELGSGNCDLFDVAKVDSASKVGEYDNIILASSTWGSGDLQSDWESFIEKLGEVDFNGKVVALVGLGDQDTYSDTFCDSLRYLYDATKNAKHIGQTDTEGYDFSDSKGVEGGKFLGLAIDQDNQEDLTDERIKKWVAEIKGSFQ